MKISLQTYLVMFIMYTKTSQATAPAYNYRLFHEDLLSVIGTNTVIIYHLFFIIHLYFLLIQYAGTFLFLPVPNKGVVETFTSPKGQQIHRGVTIRTYLITYLPTYFAYDNTS